VKAIIFDEADLLLANSAGSSEKYPVATKAFRHYMLIGKAFRTGAINTTIDVLMGRRFWRPEPSLDMIHGFGAEVLR
jgi:hypothetical protein